MRRRNRHILYVFSGLVDALIIVACFAVASWLRVGNAVGFATPVHHKWYTYGLYAVAGYAFVLVGAYALMHVYGDVFYGRIRRMAGSILLVNTIGIFVFSAGLFLIHLDDFSRLTLLRFYLSSTLLVVLKQWLVVQLLYHHRKRTDSHVPVLVVGSQRLARNYAKVISSDMTRRERVVGHVVSAATAREESSVGDAAAEPLGTCLGSVDDLDQILATHAVEQLIIALEPDEYPHVRRVMAMADKHGVLVRIVPFYNDLIPRNPAIESIRSVKLVDVRTTGLDNLFAAALKRTFDIVASAIILLLILPVMLAVALGVRLSSPGPIFFRQERIGRDRKPFMMLKFRSMRMTDAPVDTFTEDKDARKTRFGSFIRKYSLDEFPQFINVLKGDMSIVGPRPVVPEEAYTYRENIPLYMLRYQVRPGITGWAQVNGYRGDPSIAAIERRTEYDLYYIEHWSPWFDLRIFLRTIFGGFANSEKVVR